MGFSNNALGFFFFLPHYPLDFQPRIPAALCAIQNFIQGNDQDEGELPTDSRVWADALAKGFSAPAGFYYLADSGFSHCPELLIPFRGVRYHLQEWGAAGVRYVFAGVGLLFYLLLFIVQ